MSAGLVLSGGSGRELVSLLFQLLEASCIPWLVAPSSIFNAISVVFSLIASMVSWPSHSDFPCLPLIGILVITSGPPDNPG